MKNFLPIIAIAIVAIISTILLLKKFKKTGL